ncbi:MAG: hypothetical protein QG657_1296 [Acidobacteriota bacterium]|nr:hypothetical protein [Acidobacteriota bacterium]
MHEKEKEILLREVADILNIKELGDILEQKILELKAIASKFVNTLREDPKPEKNEYSNFSQEFPGLEFELDRFGKSFWVPTLPSRPGASIVSDAFPAEIMDYIRKQPMDNDIINLAKSLRFARHKDVLFDLVFVLNGPNHISGVLHKRRDPAPDEPAVNEVALGDPDDIAESLNDDEDLRLLFRYLMESRDFYNYVRSELYYRWKPFLDQQTPGDQSENPEI